MELILNDRSIHGQFRSVETFKDAIGRVMAIRAVARRLGRELQCHRNLANAQVTPGMTMPKAAQLLGRDECRSLMQWLTRHGPFWEDDRWHGDDEWLECNGEIVTDTAVGEAAYCLLHGIDRGLVSISPSSWLVSPLHVDRRHESGRQGSVDVRNFWGADELEAALTDTLAPPGSWEDLEATARSRYPDLTFSPDSFKRLQGHSFSRGAAERLLLRLDVLHQLKSCFDERGDRTPRGHEIYQQHFTGDKAWFSDSSDTEKAGFKKELTFPHPSNAGEFLYCTWHGKVKSPQLRVHFSWPIRASEQLHVVYVGPKITKR
ncbi:MAG: hypothetical protein OXG37_03585 [Actinomycetia bacterium]|nr:hypothetical protein [Actinomycetes bacterium]